MDAVVIFLMKLVAMFTTIKSATFVGIREYRNSFNEVANVVVIVGFRYYSILKRDLQALKAYTEDDVKAISLLGGFDKELVLTAINKIIGQITNNLNPETRSNQSKGQTEAYEFITKGIKRHIESGKIFVVGLTHSKVVLVDGVYDDKDTRRELTKCQDFVKKYFDFRSTKYRTYEVDENQLTSIKALGLPELVLTPKEGAILDLIALFDKQEQEVLSE